MLRSRFLPLTLLCATALRAAEPTPPLAGLTYSGDQSALEQLDRDVSAAGTDTAKLAALQSRLLALIQRPDTTFAARQALAQRLGAVLAQSASDTAKPGDYKALAAMLVDDGNSDLARLALDRVPGAAVDTVFITALGKTSGRTRLGVLDSLARRRSTAAVPAIAKLLADADAKTSAAAARALGEIADPESVAALQRTPEPSPAIIAAAKLAAAARAPSAVALPVLRDLEKNAREPVHRVAAFRELLDLDRAAAVGRITAALDGSDWSLKQAALEAVAASRAEGLITALTGKIATWDAPTQAGVIAAFARRPEPATVSAVVQAAAHREAEVRRAAIEALGTLPGSRETATLLAKVAAGSDTEDARIARLSLARLNGPEVNSTVLAGAERGDTALRVVYLEQIAQRGLTEGIPLLLKTRTDPDAAIRLAAVGALGDLATPAEQSALIEWAVGATDEAEQARALRSLVALVLRSPAGDTRGRAVYEAIERAPRDVAIRLLPALPRLGGAASAACAGRLAQLDDQTLADAAVATLGRWPDSAALPTLADLAVKATLPAVRTAALDQALKAFERTRAPWTASASTTLGTLLPQAKDAATKKRIVALLNRGNDRAALKLATGLQSDTEVGAAAGEAVEIIESNLAGKPTLRASGAETSVANMIDGKTSSRWNLPTLGEEWIEAGFKASRPIHRITLDQTGRGSEFPESFEVYVTDDVANPGAPRATGKGKQNRTVIDLPAGTRGRYVIIRNVAERKDSQWSVCEWYID